MSSARIGAFCLSGFVLLELAVYLRAFKNPAPSYPMALEGPLSLLMLAFAAGYLTHDKASRRWGIMVLVSMGAALLAATVPISPPPTSDYLIEVNKGKKTLRLFRSGQEVAVFPIALGPHPQGTKTRQGDGRTPEGRFLVCDKAPSTFHLWLGINYPTNEDAWRARREGVLTWTELALVRFQNLNGRIPYGNGPLGGAIGIHGGGSKKNWTLGCVALENDDVEKLYEAAGLGTTVEILP